VLGERDGMRALRVKHRAKKRETPLRRSSDAGALRARRRAGREGVQA